MSYSFTESINKAFSESPSLVARGGASPHGRGISYMATYSCGAGKYTMTYSGSDKHYHSATSSDVNEFAVPSSSFAYGGSLGGLSSQIVPYGNTQFALTKVTEEITCSPSLAGLTGIASTIKVREISGKTGTFLSDSTTSSANWPYDFANPTASWTTSFTNTGEGGSVTVARTATQDFDIYDDGYSVYSYYPVGSTGHSGTFIGTTTFSYTWTITWENDYTDSDFFDDFDALLAELKSQTGNLTSATGKVLVYNKIGAIVDFGSADSFSGGTLYSYSNIGSFGQIQGMTSVGGSSSTWRMAMGFSAYKLRIWSDFTSKLALFSCTTDLTGSSPYSAPTVSVSSRTSVLLPSESIDFVIAPSDADVTALKSSTPSMKEIVISNSEDYSVPSPAWPTPS